MKDDDIPLIHAIPIMPLAGVPIVQATTVSSTTNHDVYFVDLPIGPSNLGFQVQGTPPQISVIQKNSPMAGLLQVGHYVHGILMPGIEVVNFPDPDQLMFLIHTNASIPRQLKISSTPFHVDPILPPSASSGALYIHSLPATSNLGISLQGFPPVVTAVAPLSPVVTLHPGQTVEALLVPGQPVMNLAAGAFTATRLEERLLHTSHLKGRRLVVRNGSHPSTRKEKGSNAAFDDCVIS